MIFNNFGVCRNIWLTVFIIFVFLCNTLVYSSTHDDPFNSDGSLKRVSSIRIVPYNPLAGIIEKNAREEDRVLLSAEVVKALKIDFSRSEANEYINEYNEKEALGKINYVPLAVTEKAPLNADRVLLPDEVVETLQLKIGFSRSEAGAHIREYHREPVTEEGVFDPTRMRFGVAVKPDQYAFPTLENELFPAELGAYQDYFGFGRNCIYAPEELNQFGFILDTSDSTAASVVVYDTAESLENIHGNYVGGSHGYYLQQLVLYQKELKTRDNLLLVNMKLEIEGEAELCDYIFGVFVSGAHNTLNSCPINDLSQSYFKTKTYEKNELKKEDQFVKFWGYNALLAGRKRIEEAADAVALAVQNELVLEKQKYRLGDRIYYSHFPLEVYKETKFLLLGQELGRNEKEMNKLLSERLWHSPSLKFSNAEMSLIGYQNVFKLRYKFLKNLFGDDTLVPALLTKQLSEAYLDTETYNFAGACGTVFNQSEQAFLSFLTKSSPENYKALKPLSVTEGNDKHCIKRIRLDLYSTYDICRYCRGTLAYMLYNGALRENIVNFFRNQNISLDFTDLRDLQIYAFSNKTTGIGIGGSI